MCIDIHTGNYTSFDDGLLEYYIKKKIKDLSNDSYHEHNLTMLDSFHISLGKPPEGIEPQIIPLEIHEPGPQLAVGYITLSDIKISETENKKSAWIDVKDLTWAIIDRNVETCFAQEHSEHWVLAKYESMVRRNETSMPLNGNWPTWHISLANLTGKPRDSIAHPEGCIIDTITN